MVKPPFSKRHDPEQLEEFLALRDGIPAGLRPSLLKWSRLAFLEEAPWGGQIVNRTKLEYSERLTNTDILSPKDRDDLDVLERRLGASDELHLDVVEVALHWVSDKAVEVLEQFFIEARSAYCIGRDAEGNRELQFRQPPEMSELIETEARQSGHAATHLRNAWSKCFGLNPDPKGACREAVEAIEVAAKPVVTPNDPVATLGKMCSAIRLKPEKWETDSDFDGSVLTVLAMMDMVWKGHLRHGDESAPLEVSQEAAEMTVQTAALLVSWFRSGRIRLKS